ncbi:hypothetical protein P170DRAFT_45173 [Aspergillus steynii IBT 23096]|uniref:Uncharacterized protein n=1 Tax=Aspergillus steynii IBT 23096 TaxID=1392250 RepID=A0A2I2GRU0_9EURO|nr:uncharacterized protein P170DRAFT_45173 [Aspergillus steynii IBT 23096]PLB55590.1 hypothetical protein P170DRAFT_45173 [Aspergillus steynii IBT 23096]
MKCLYPLNMHSFYIQEMHFRTARQYETTHQEIPHVTQNNDRNNDQLKQLAAMKPHAFIQSVRIRSPMSNWGLYSKPGLDCNRLIVPERTNDHERATSRH